MLARHSDAAFLGEALKHFDMQLIRGAGAAGRGKDRGGSHAYRSAIQALRDGRAVAMTADVPGGQARQAGLGIVMAAKQSGRPILPVAIATTRYIALNTWSRMTINLPYSRLGFAVGPLVHVPREATTEELEGYRQAVEDVAERRDRAGLRPRRRRSDARHARRARAPARTEPGCAPQGLSHAHQPGAPGGAAAARPARAARQGGAAAAQRAAGPAERRAARGPARLVPCRQRRRDQRHSAADVGAGARRARRCPSCSPPAR